MAALLCFASDLRVSDHKPLADAMASSEPVHACFFFYEPALKKYGGRRNQFLLDSLIILEKNLSHLGVRLHVLSAQTIKEAETAFKKLLLSENISSLFFHEPIDKDEKYLISTLSKHVAQTHSYCDQTLFNPGQIINASHEPFKVFTPFFRKARSVILENRGILKISARPKKRVALESQNLNPPPWLELMEYDREAFPAGEKAGLARLKDFVGDDVKDYAKMRDFFGQEGTSRLSPYLALGILSIRACLAELFHAQERALHQAASGASIFFSELIWREFYRHLWIFFPKLESGEPFREQSKHIQWRRSKSDLLAWQQGQTGIPIIDAAMRKFNQSGFMHNRLRMIVASFLSKNLLLDWRLGEEYFLKNLIDADVASNNGGWQWSASVGVDPQPYFRVFNPVSQSQRYDEEGEFIRTFVPELQYIDKKNIHAPFIKLSSAELKKLNYPSPLCDLGESRRHAIEVFAQAFKKTTSTNY